MLMGVRGIETNAALGESTYSGKNPDPFPVTPESYFGFLLTGKLGR